jgi:hypothetical protein
VLDAALDYAVRRSWPVFPLWPGAKTPATKRGLHAATTDPATITRWWERHPTMNVGIACGPARLLVVDLDYKPGGVDGLREWWPLVEQAGADHAGTYTVCTPSGGLHFYFHLEPGWCIGNSASKLAPGIDIRAEGGYVVAPPSRTSDGAYENDDLWTELLDAPAWLIDRLIAKPAPKVASATRVAVGDGTPYGFAALEGELGRLAVCAEGTRNDTLVRAAFNLGRLIAGGQLDATHATGQLITVALRIGLTEREAVATIRSGLEAGAQQPRVPR